MALWLLFHVLSPLPSPCLSTSEFNIASTVTDTTGATPIRVHLHPATAASLRNLIYCFGVCTAMSLQNGFATHLGVMSQRRRRRSRVNVDGHNGYSTNCAT